MTLLLILYSITFSLLVVCIHLQSLIGIKRLFDKLLTILLIHTALHILHSITFCFITSQYQYIKIGVPFGLFYGSMLYLLLLTGRNECVTVKKVLLHFFPYYLSLIIYVYFLITPSLQQSELYYIVLYSSISISWFVYALYGLFISTKSVNTLQDRKVKQSSIPVFLILFTMAFTILLSIKKSTSESRMILSLVIASGILGLVVFIYLLLVSQLTVFREKNKLSAIKKDAPLDTYAKSHIEDKLLKEYLNKIEAYLNKKPYLNQDFTLTTLSKATNIPKHDLSQIFNKKYGMSFPIYINIKRIEHACSILKDKQYSNEDIAYLIGYESKSTFYRNFKNIKKCTPKEYQQRHS